MHIKVVREKLTPCCTGKMYVDGVYFGKTLERPWLNNATNVSAIPAEVYRVGVSWSTKFNKKMLVVYGVPQRDGIRIHNANSWSQLEGCIAVAKFSPTPETLFFGLADKLAKMVFAELHTENVWIEMVNPHE